VTDAIKIRDVGRSDFDHRRIDAFYWQTHQSNVTAQRPYDRIAERSGFIVYRKDF
jgi:hypothetical protein